jgi:K+-transporting ATPase KdpF subunit
MTWLHALAGAASVGLFAYLVVALLNAEDF